MLGDLKLYQFAEMRPAPAMRPFLIRRHQATNIPPRWRQGGGQVAFVARRSIELNQVYPETHGGPGAKPSSCVFSIVKPSKEGIDVRTAPRAQQLGPPEAPGAPPQPPPDPSVPPRYEDPPTPARPAPPVIDDPPRLRNASLKTGRSNRRGHYTRDQSTFWLIGNRA